jgi:prevent-host-death family protein
MCYMSEATSQRARVGVRDLRQNLSVYLRRVERGETLDVTERGRLVARLTPAPVERMPALDRLVAEGRAVPAERDLLEHEPIELGPGPSLSDVLRRMREEDER